MRHAPFFITLPDGNLVNVDQITYVQSNGAGCFIHFAAPSSSGTFHGTFEPGGRGSQSGNSTTSSEFISCPLSRADLLALINKEVALVHAMEGAAK
jgi:hypothetical protein